MNTPSEASAELARVVRDMRESAADLGGGPYSGDAFRETLLIYANRVARADELLSSHGGGGGAVRMGSDDPVPDLVARFCNPAEAYRAGWNDRCDATPFPQPRAEGMVLVPAVPTEAMLHALMAEMPRCWNTGDEVGIGDAADAYRKLLAAAPGEGSSADAKPVIVRHNDDGTLDEVVGIGQFHLEQMDGNKWWMQLGPHMVTLTARGKITAWFGENEACESTPPPASQSAERVIGDISDECMRPDGICETCRQPLHASQSATPSDPRAQYDASGKLIAYDARGGGMYGPAATPSDGPDLALVARMLETVAAGSVYGRDAVIEQIRLLEAADNAAAVNVRTANRTPSDERERLDVVATDGCKASLPTAIPHRGRP